MCREERASGARGTTSAAASAFTLAANFSHLGGMGSAVPPPVGDAGGKVVEDDTALLAVELLDPGTAPAVFVVVACRWLDPSPVVGGDTVSWALVAAAVEVADVGCGGLLACSAWAGIWSAGSLEGGIELCSLCSVTTLLSTILSWLPWLVIPGLLRPLSPGAALAGSSASAGWS